MVWSETARWRLLGTWTLRMIWRNILCTLFHSNASTRMHSWHFQIYNHIIEMPNKSVSKTFNIAIWFPAWLTFLRFVYLGRDLSSGIIDHYICCHTHMHCLSTLCWPTCSTNTVLLILSRVDIGMYMNLFPQDLIIASLCLYVCSTSTCNVRIDRHCAFNISIDTWCVSVCVRGNDLSCMYIRCYNHVSLFYPCVIDIDLHPTINMCSRDLLQQWNSYVCPSHNVDKS